MQIATTLNWKTLQSFCDAVWPGKKTHNRQRDFYEYLQQQPTLQGVPALVQAVSDEKVVGFLGWLKFQWGEQAVASALNWYTLPGAEQTGLAGALLGNEWRKQADIQVAAHPRAQLAEHFRAAGWHELVAHTYWYPVRLAGLHYAWPGRRQPGRAILVMGQYLRSLLLRRQLPATVKSQPFDAELDQWLRELKAHYTFFDRESSYLTWQYGRWQPSGERWESYSVLDDQRKSIGWFVLRLGKPRAVICECLAVPGQWQATLAAALAAAAAHPATAVVQVRTQVRELEHAGEQLGCVAGRAIPTFIRAPKQTLGRLKEATRPLILSAGDSDEYLL